MNIHPTDISTRLTAQSESTDEDALYIPDGGYHIDINYLPWERVAISHRLPSSKDDLNSLEVTPIRLGEFLHPYD